MFLLENKHCATLLALQKIFLFSLSRGFNIDGVACEKTLYNTEKIGSLMVVMMNENQYYLSNSLVPKSHLCPPVQVLYI